MRGRQVMAMPYFKKTSIGSSDEVIRLELFVLLTSGPLDAVGCAEAVTAQAAVAARTQPPAYIYVGQSLIPCLGEP